MNVASLLGFMLIVSHLSFGQQSQQWTANIHPNPSKGIVYIKLTGKEDELTHVNVVNIAGQSVFTKNVENARVHLVDLRHLPNGNYTVQMMSTNIYMRQPLIIL